MTQVSVDTAVQASKGLRSVVGFPLCGHQGVHGACPHQDRTAFSCEPFAEVFNGSRLRIVFKS